MKAIKDRHNKGAWTVRSGSTVSKWTGPTWDHTRDVSSTTTFFAPGGSAHVKEAVLPVTAGWNDAASYATQDKAYTVQGMFKGEACSATLCTVKKVENRLDLKDVQHTRVRLQLRFWTVGTWGKSSNVEYGKAFVDNTMVWEAPRDSPSQCVAASGTGDRQWIEYGGSFGATSAPVRVREAKRRDGMRSEVVEAREERRGVLSCVSMYVWRLGALLLPPIDLSFLAPPSVHVPLATPLPCFLSSF